MKIVIMGLGLYEKGSGISATKFFIEKGDQVLITDLKSKKELSEQIKKIKEFCKKKKKPIPEFSLGGHRKEDFNGADIVMQNPGVKKNSPFLRFAKKQGAEIETDISIFLKNSLARIIGITGTRGKSTTSALVYEILKVSGKRAWLGGNIQISPLSFIKKIKPGDFVVLELSSWMLENFDEFKFAPHIAVVTNIYKDHLNMHKNMEEYISAKKNIFKNQKKSDYLILNGEDMRTKKWRGLGKTIYFYKKDTTGFKSPLEGEHNKENISAALAVSKILKIQARVCKKAITGFSGLPYRQEIISKQGGVLFVNDTTATSPDGAIAALKRFGNLENKKIILICGGADKGLDYKDFAKKARKYCKEIILLPGSATIKVKKSISNFQFPISNIFETDNMKEAVIQAKKLAIKEDIVLLSPGAASFGLFKNEFDRGEQFNKVVKHNII